MCFINLVFHQLQVQLFISMPPLVREVALSCLDDVHCSGTESRLVNCISNRVNYHDCSHFEDAGVTCQSKI